MKVHRNYNITLFDAYIPDRVDAKVLTKRSKAAMTAHKKRNSMLCPDEERNASSKGSSRPFTRVFLLVLIALIFVFPSIIWNASAFGNLGPFSGAQVVGYQICTSTELTCTTARTTNFYTVAAQGSWVVPPIKTCGATEISTINYELGIDFASNGVNTENGAGINLFCINGAVGFAGRVFQAGSVNYLGSSQYPIQAGDHMNAKVAYNGTTGKFTVVLHDSTHVWTYRTGPYSDGSATLFGGEYLMTSSCTNQTLCPIPNFGTLHTSNDYLTISTHVTGGTKGSLGHWFAKSAGSNPTAFVMRFSMEDTAVTNNILATASAITSTSTGFSFSFVISS